MRDLVPVLIAAFAGLAAGAAHAEPVIAPRPTELPGVTSVTEQPEVTVTMGLQMNPTNEQGDSVRWWERRQAGWKRWVSAQREFPRLKSRMAEMYLGALAEGFNRTLPTLPRTRFHFYVVDTLNPSIWPVGGGFFIVHAGLLTRIQDERQFAFLMALELAHEVLGHNFTPVRAGDIKWEPGRWRAGDYDGWPVEFWAFLVGRDPIERGGFAYGLQQESDALELVYRFFQANVWEYEGINRIVPEILPKLAEIPGTSSLARMHPHLAMAVRLPHARPAVPLAPADSVVSRATYAQMQQDVARSTLQHYPWMLELVPYRDFVLAKRINVDRLRESYNPHADVRNRKFDRARRKPKFEGLEGDLADLEDRNEDLDDRSKLKAAKLARAYLRGLILTNHHRWKEVVGNAEEALKLAPMSEPFLWQRAQARQQLSQFNPCIRELSQPWRFFDHRRDLLVIQCSFLEGRYTDAARAADAYRRKYPFDIDGAFWQTLSAVRMRRAFDYNIAEIEAFWGDRPVVRALKIFHLSYLGRLTEARSNFDFASDIRYLPQEWGIFEFAQAWMRETFSPIHDDDRAAKLSKLAELQWPLAHLVRYNLPRDVVQER